LKLPPGLIQHSKPGEVTVYGNAITRVLLAVVDEGAGEGRGGQLYVGYSRRFELKLTGTACGSNPGLRAAAESKIAASARQTEFSQ
jgi:hypothetical protein